MTDFPSLASSGPSSLQNAESLSSLGGRDPEFVSTSDKERFTCPVHHGFLQDPRQTNCGHRMCAKCVDKHLNGATSKPCPVGEADCENISKDQVFRDNSIVREMKRANIYCYNKGAGCQAKVPLQSINEHVGECLFEMVPCGYSARGCGETVLRRKLQEHKSICPCRPERCSLCLQEVNYSQLQEHDKESCPEKVTGCPFGCGKKDLKRKEVSGHRDVCPVQPVDCKFKHMGCTFSNKRELVAKHEKEELSAHLELVTVKTAALEVQSLDFQRQLQTMSVERDDLQRNLQSMGPDAGAQPIHQMETQIRDFRLKLVSMMEKVIIMERKVPDLAERPRVEALEQTLTGIQQRLAQLEQTRERDRQQPSSRERDRLQQSSSGGGGGEGVNANTRVGRFGTVEAMAETLSTQLTAHDRQLGVHDVRMAEMDLRFQLLETASYDGTLVWKIRDYERRKRDAVNGRTLSLYSQPFYSDRFGYKMCARVYLNGDGMGKTTHMSLFFVVMRGEYDALLNWPFRQKVTLTLLDQSAEKRHLTDHFQPDPNSSSFQRPTSEMNVASGCPLFVSHAVLENPSNGYLRDDTIFIRIVVDRIPNPAVF